MSQPERCLRSPNACKPALTPFGSAPSRISTMKRFLLSVALSCCWIGIMRGQQTNTTPASSFHPPKELFAGGQEDLWFGFKRHIFQLAGCTCWLVEPKVPLAG